MITVQNIHLKDEKTGRQVSQPLEFIHKMDEFTKLSTEIDGKEAFLTLIGAKNLIPEVCAKNLDTSLEDKLGIQSKVYKIDLDLNSKNILVLRKRAVKLFDDSALLIKYRVPKENLQIKLIKKFTNNTSIRYIKLSKDKKECIAFVTFRTLFMHTRNNKCEDERVAQFVNTILDGSLSMILEDTKTGECFRENISPLIHFNKAISVIQSTEILPINTKSISIEFDNVICIEKGFNLIKGFNSIKDDLNTIITPKELSNIKFDEKKVTEIYGLHLKNESIMSMNESLKNVKGRFRFFNIYRNGHMHLEMSHNMVDDNFKEDHRIHNHLTENGKIVQSIEMIKPQTIEESLVPYTLTKEDTTFMQKRERNKVVHPNNRRTNNNYQKRDNKKK